MKQVGCTDTLGRTHGGSAPFGAVRVVYGHEGRFATHGQAHIATNQIVIDAMPQRFDRGPLLIAIGLGNSRRFPDALDLHAVLEYALAFFGGAGNWRGRRWLWRARHRDMSFASEQPGRRIEADPAGTRQEDLTPGVQIGEVNIGTGRTVQRFHIGHQLNQIT